VRERRTNFVIERVREKIYLGVCVLVRVRKCVCVCVCVREREICAMDEMHLVPTNFI
jgi:hypothetical protein